MCKNNNSNQNICILIIEIALLIGYVLNIVKFVNNYDNDITRPQLVILRAIGVMTPIGGFLGYMKLNGEK